MIWYCVLPQNVFRSFNISLERENSYWISFWNEISFQIFQIKLPTTTEVTTVFKCYSMELCKPENPPGLLISGATHRIGAFRGANPLNLRSQTWQYIIGIYQAYSKLANPWQKFPWQLILAALLAGSVLSLSQDSQVSVFFWADFMLFSSHFLTEKEDLFEHFWTVLIKFVTRVTSNSW